MLNDRPHPGPLPQEREKPRTRFAASGNFLYGCHLNELSSELPELGVGLLLARVGGDTEDASQDADDIAVQYRFGLIERDATNRASGVVADSGQCKDVVELFGKLATVVRDDLLCGFLQIADAGVIAETFPEFMKFCG